MIFFCEQLLVISYHPTDKLKMGMPVHHIIATLEEQMMKTLQEITKKNMMAKVKVQMLFQA